MDVLELLVDSDSSDEGAEDYDDEDYPVLFFVCYSLVFLATLGFRVPTQLQSHCLQHRKEY